MSDDRLTRTLLKQEIEEFLYHEADCFSRIEKS